MTAIKKIPLIPGIFLLIYLCVFSINQWRAENSYPVERNFIRGIVSQGIPDHRQAEEVKRSIHLSPGMDKYYVLLGKYYVYRAPEDKKPTYGERRDLLKKAEKEYIKALYLNPSNTEVLAYLAWVEFSLGQPFKALGRLETAIRLDPSNYFTHLFYGICIANFLDSLPENLRKIYLYRANEEFKAGLELNPSLKTHPSVFMARARLYLEKGALGAAIRQIENIGEIDRTTLPYHLKLANLYIKAGRGKAGIEKYRALLQNLNLDTEDRGKIIASLKTETGTYPKNIELRFLLGKAYFKEKQWDMALKILKEVADVRPDKADVYYLMGQTYESLGNKNASIKEYMKTLKYSKNHEGASKKVLEYYKGKLAPR